jgi:prepilin signal peptidase PulO-like enzyme (type II secretory pathway)
MIYIYAFFLGAVFASFITQLAFRFENEWSFGGRSKCDMCKEGIGDFYLIPVVGYFLSKGRCSKCGNRINIFYPVIEISIGVASIFGVVYGWSVLSWLGFAVLSYFAVYDLLYRKLPATFLNVLLLAVLSYFFLMSIPIETTRYISFAIVLFIGLLTAFNAFGLGDFIILSIASTILAPIFFINSFMWSIIIGSILGVLLLILKKSDLKEKIAYVPLFWLGILFAECCDIVGLLF